MRIYLVGVGRWYYSSHMRYLYQLTRLLILTGSLLGLWLVLELVQEGASGLAAGLGLTLATGVLVLGAYAHSVGPLAFWRSDV